MNHLREILEAIDGNKVSVSSQLSGRNAHHFLGLFCEAASNAMCFEIGDIDDISSFKTIPELSRLPFSHCWFEYSVGGYLCGVLLVDTDMPNIRQAGFLFNKIQGSWAFSHTWNGAPLHAEKQKGDDVMVAVFGLGPGDEDKTQSAMLSRMAISAFLGALHCSNVPRELNKPSDKLKKARQRRDKKPLFSYWTLNLDINGAQNDCAASGISGIRKRLHIRRGHPREYSPGKWTWVREHLAGNKALGMIHKDYKAVYH